MPGGELNERISLSFRPDHADQIIDGGTEKAEGSGQRGAGGSPSPQHDENEVKHNVDGISKGQSDGAFLYEADGPEEVNRSVGNNDERRPPGKCI